MVKQIDFQRERTSSPSLSIDPGPDLRKLLRGKAIGGPCDGAKLEGPGNWDGQVTYNYPGGSRPHPGRYIYGEHEGAWAWVWQGNEPSPKPHKSARAAYRKRRFE